MGRQAEEPLLHIVFTKEAMLLVKRPGVDWRALQDEFFDYKSSLGPYDIDGVVDALRDEWPGAHARQAEIREFSESSSTVLSL
jgi:hypothetical protein